MNADPEASSIECDFGDDCDYAAECCEPNEVEVESAWTKTTVGILLEECLKKKKELHNPRHRRNKFFNEIRDSMLERGFVFDAKTLEKKFHNLKKHFTTICQSRERDVTPTKPISWPYYEQMMSIFAEELEIEDAPTMASLYPDLPPKKAPIQSPKPERNPQVRHYSEEELELKDSNSDEESRWVHKSVMAFLDECCKKKQELWDPQIRRRKIFDEIRRRLKEQGYFFYQESLDRKLRNMKKQFQVVSETIQRNKINSNGKRRRITWPYYEKLKELYGQEMEREIRRKRGMNAYTETQSQPIKSSVLALKFRPIAPKPGEQATPTATNASQSTIIVAMPATPKNNQFIESVDTACPPSTFNYSSPAPNDTILQAVAVSKQHTDANHDDEKLKFIRQIVALEERRTIVAEQMLAEMIESNKIREKRLEFNRIKLDYAMARRKRKKNGSI